MDAPGPCACPASELLDSSWLDSVCAPSGAACLVPCAANEHVISNACVECNGLTNAPGDYPGSGDTPCNCPPGRFGDGVSCVDCAPGQYGAVEGLSCVGCSPGQYTDSSAATHCIECATGQYADTSAAVGCIGCAPGLYSTTPASVQASDCIGCGAGQYSDSGSATDCVGCPLGQFSSVVGSSSASACEPGIPPACASEYTACDATDDCSLAASVIYNTSSNEIWDSAGDEQQALLLCLHLEAEDAGQSLCRSTQLGKMSRPVLQSYCAVSALCAKIVLDNTLPVTVSRLPGCCMLQAEIAEGQLSCPLRERYHCCSCRSTTFPLYPDSGNCCADCGKTCEV